MGAQRRSVQPRRPPGRRVVWRSHRRALRGRVDVPSRARRLESRVDGARRADADERHVTARRAVVQATSRITWRRRPFDAWNISQNCSTLCRTAIRRRHVSRDRARWTEAFINLSLAQATFSSPKRRLAERSRIITELRTTRLRQTPGNASRAAGATIASHTRPWSVASSQ